VTEEGTLHDRSDGALRPVDGPRVL
jgi:hypothetical protein